MPSRHMLHVRVVRSEHPKRVRRGVGSWSALGAPRKIKFSIGFPLFWPLQAPLLAAPGMRPVLYLFYFYGFKKVTIFNQKTEIRNYFLRVLVAQNSCKIAQNHLGGDQKNQELIRELEMGIDVCIFSFEGGGALPEDTSREGCVVGMPETCDPVKR